MGLLVDLELFLAQWGRCKLGARLIDTPWSLQLTTAQCLLTKATEGGFLIGRGFLIRPATCKSAVDGDMCGAACYNTEAMQAN